VVEADKPPYEPRYVFFEVSCVRLQGLSLDSAGRGCPGSRHCAAGR